MKRRTVKIILTSGLIASLMVTGSFTTVLAAESNVAEDFGDATVAEQAESPQTGDEVTGIDGENWEDYGTDAGNGSGTEDLSGAMNETSGSDEVQENESQTIIIDEIIDDTEIYDVAPELETEEETGTLYSGEDGSLTWSIDEEGLLVIDGDGNCEGVPDWLEHTDAILTADVDVIGVTDMGEWFSNCSNLTYIDLTDADTSEVTNMSSMFSGCSSLQSLDLSGFDTTKVNDMGMMFYGCYSLTSLDLSNFNTSRVTTWNSEIATGMTGMFTDCSNLTSLNISSFDTSNITDMAWMFYGCSSLQSLDLSSFNTSNVSSFDSMFKNCSSLQSLDLGSFSTSNVVNLSSMFESCNQLSDLNLDSFTFDQVVNVSGMFANCYAVNTSFTITSNMQTADYYDYTDMFFDTAIYQGAGVTIYYGGDCPENLVIAMAATGSAESLIEIKKMKDTSAFPVDGVDGNITWSIDKDGNLTLDGNGNIDGTPDWLAYASSIISVDVNVTGSTSMAGWFQDCGTSSFDFSDADTSAVRDMSTMFSGCGNITELDLSGLNTSLVTDMREMFASCTRLTSINLGNLNTANVADMAGMFYDCKNLQSLDLSSFNTANVTDMCGMFSQCYNVESINVSSFDTSNVTDMGAMFSNCYKLQSLDLSNFDTSSVITWSSEVASGMASMFAQCASLTSLDLSSFDTSGVTDMTWMFYDCNLLQNINLSSFDTSNVISMGWMFYGCSSLTSLDLSNFDTSNVNGMYYMFADCNQLRELNLESFSFENAQNFDGMFSNCENINTSFTISTNFEDKDFYNYEGMFSNAATAEDSRIVLYYNGKCTEEIALRLAETASEESNIIVAKRYITITSQPQSVDVVEGDKFTFQTTAISGSDSTLSYLWQYSKDGGTTWIDTTRTRDNYSTTATNALNGRMYRCVITDEDGQMEISKSATLMVSPAVEITSQTSNLTVNEGVRYSFKVTAVSNRGSSLSYLWQYSKNQKTWTDTTRKLNNYGTTANTAMDGMYYRCMITDADGYVTYSEPAMLRVLSDIVITSQPEDQIGTIGVKFTFRVAATGSSLTYLWQYSKDGGKTWINTSRTRNNYGTLASKSLNGRMYRCIITDSSNNSIISNAATLTVE